MSLNEWSFFQLCFAVRAYRMLGFGWKKKIEIHEELLTGDIVVRYE